MTIFLDQDGFKPALKEMAYSAMKFVEKLCIDAVQLPHAKGKVTVRGFDQDVIMIRHQTVGMTDPIVSFGDMLKSVEKIDSVLIGSKYRLFLIST